MMPWREISREMRQLRVAVVVMFAVSVAATLATGYIEHVAMEQPAESSPAYRYPLHVNDTVRYLRARQREIYRMGAPVIETSWLLLRPWRDEDVECWVAMNADPRVMEFFERTDERAESEATAATLRAAYYRQDYFWARILNNNPYDRLRGSTNVNLTVILTSQAGWQVMLYDKNIFNTTAITGTFLNSDDSGLTTNVFLTDPKLIGIRVTKNW